MQYGWVGPDLTGTSVQGNSAENGGGIYNDDILDGYGDLSLAASMVSGNKSGANGGGIYEAPGTGPVTLTSSPVLCNKPDNCEPPGSITGCTR